MSEFADGLKQGLSFVIRNKAPGGKKLTIFGTPVNNGSSIDLMQIPGISEDDIKASILKGELGNKLRANYISVVSSTLIFESSDPTYTALLTSFGLSASSASPGNIGSVVNIAALALINDASETDGAERFVTTLLTPWILDKSSTLTVDNITVVATQSGTGRWIREHVQHPRWIKSSDWYLDPVSGNDENTGISSGSPVKTLKELSRRMSGYLKRDKVNINLLNNVTDATDLLSINYTQEESGVQGGGGAGLTFNIGINILGQRTTASFTDPNTASTTSLTMTAGAVAPALTSVPNGLPGVITVSGFDFTPHVGRHIEILTSGVSTSVGSVGVIVSAPSIGTAWISPLTTWNSPLTTISHNTLSSAQYPSSGSTFRIYTNTTWAPFTGVTTQLVPNAATVFQNIEFTSTASSVVRNQQFMFFGCTLRRPVRPSAGGEGGPFWLFHACSVIYTAPTSGRTPTQWQHTSGDVRLSNSGLINVDLRIREGDAKCQLINCVMDKSMITIGGPNDAGRAGSPTGFTGLPPAAGGTGTSYGLGIFNWPGPDLLAPSPATTRGSSGAAIHIGHGAKSVLAAPIYGNCATTGTTGIKVQEGAQLYVVETLTANTSPVNPPAPSPAYIASSLRLMGTDGYIQLDGYLQDGYSKHITYDNFRGVLSGTVTASPSLFVPLTTWTDWEDPTKFNRNAFSILTGAGIIKILS